MEEIVVQAGRVELMAFLEVPQDATGIVLFVHGSGSSRHSLRNQMVARTCSDEGLAILLVDLLTVEEEEVDMIDQHFRFDIPMLAKRVIDTIDWLETNEATRHLNIGLCGSSTGAAAALIAAAERPTQVQAVASRGGRPDLAAKILSRVIAPTLLIVGSDDTAVLRLNQDALLLLAGEKRFEIIPGATHLFSEPGTLERAANLIHHWFTQKLLSVY